LNGGKVLVAGGTDVSGFALAGAEIYNPTSGTWSATGAMATARSTHTLTLLPGGKALVAGGTGGQRSSRQRGAVQPDLRNLERRAPDDRRQAQPHRDPSPSGKVLVAGGSGSSIALASAQLYDPASGTWSPTGSMVSARTGHTATLLSNNKVLVAGGLGTAGLVTNAEIYDPSVGTWTSTGAMIAPRFYHSETLLFGGKVLVAGGSGGSGFLSSAELYDPSAGTWSPRARWRRRENFTPPRASQWQGPRGGRMEGFVGADGCGALQSRSLQPQPDLPLPRIPPISIFATPYSQSIRAIGGGGLAGPCSFEISDGALPPGLALGPDTGNLEGIPTLEGTFDFTVVARVLDGSESAASQAYSLPVVSPIPIDAFSSVTDSSVSLSWTGVGGATGYSVWRAEGPSCSNAVKITDIPVEGTAFDDRGLRCGGTYSYFATAEGVCCLPPSGECGTVTLETCSVPVEAAPLIWTDKDTLAWPAVAGAWSYRLYRGTRSSLSGLLDGSPNSCTVYDDAAALSWGAGDPSLLQPGRFLLVPRDRCEHRGRGISGRRECGVPHRQLLRRLPVDLGAGDSARMPLR
jgi:hypothetical protein